MMMNQKKPLSPTRIPKPGFSSSCSSSSSSSSSETRSSSSKSSPEIQVITTESSATVEKHLRLAREALSVETTAQAVLKAALQNQMFVMEA